MQIDLGLIFAAIAGAGTLVGAIAGLEQYLGGKTQGLIDRRIDAREYDRQLRHLERQLGDLSSAIARVQDQEMDLETRLSEKIERGNAKTSQCFTRMNEMRIRHEKLETAARVLGATIKGDASITAILAERTDGT